MENSKKTFQENTQNDDIDFGELFKLFKDKIAWILVFAFLGAAIAYAFSSFIITPVYRATATVYVNNRKTTAYIESVSQNALTVSALLVPTYQYIIQTKTAMQKAIDGGNIEGYSAEDLVKMLSTSADEETGVFYITVSGKNRYDLADIANAIADYSTLEIGKYIEGTDVSVVDDAVTPEYPSSPNTTKNTAVGFVAGMLLAALAVWIIDGFGLDLKKSEDFANALNAPVLGEIPFAVTAENENIREVRSNGKK